jgi:hypothetical protein
MSGADALVRVLSPNDGYTSSPAVSNVVGNGPLPRARHGGSIRDRDGGSDGNSWLRAVVAWR